MSEPIDIDRICAEQSLWLTRLEHWLAGYCEAQRVLSRAELFPDRWAFFEHPRPGDDLPIRRQFCPSVPTTRCEPREVSDAKQLLGRIFGLSPWNASQVRLCRFPSLAKRACSQVSDIRSYRLRLSGASTVARSRARTNPFGV
jgi:hypothetical protein